MNARIAIYSRVSTADQSTDAQLLELRDYCRRRGWENVAEYTDTISGSNFSRSGLDKLMTLVRKGRIDVVLAYKLDRLGRSLPHLAQLLTEFTGNQVALVCPSQGIDTTSANPAAQLQLNILAAVAQFERDLIRERTVAGLNAARARGVKLGRPRTIHKNRAAVAALVALGNSINGIARELQLPVSSVHRLVTEIRLNGE